MYRLKVAIKTYLQFFSIKKTIFKHIFFFKKRGKKSHRITTILLLFIDFYLKKPIKLYHKKKKQEKVCMKIIGPRFWRGIYLIRSLRLERCFQLLF